MKAPPIHPKKAADTAGATVRRFEMGASGVGDDQFLKRKGYDVKAGPNAKFYNVIGPKGGRAVKLTPGELRKLLDCERVRAGLQPVTPQGGRDESVYKKLLGANKRGPKRAA
ncbi:MAG: hypothetical protein IT566_10085 [Rhodospirillaceae bacterium]|nr:hypothetical protein [Rhodospirillaceae bacterium]